MALVDVNDYSSVPAGAWKSRGNLDEVACYWLMQKVFAHDRQLRFRDRRHISLPVLARPSPQPTKGCPRPFTRISAIRN